MENDSRIPLFFYADETAADCNSLYRGRVMDRDELLAFMDENEWFGSFY